MKKSEKAAREALRRHEGVQMKGDHVPVVTRKGARLEYNQGQSVSQGFGSGIRDMLAGRKKKGGQG